MKDASYAPMYCALYPKLAEVARKHGYAMAVHGSLGRDFDLVCIPWVKSPSDPEEVVSVIVKRFALWNADPGNPHQKLHGRKCWTLTIGFGHCYLDLSFMPREKVLE